MAIPTRANGKYPREFRLEYPGKKSECSILSTPAQKFEMDSEYVGGENRLYHSDNLPVLATLAKNSNVAGRIKLVYIDPPFGSASSFKSRNQKHAYDDFLVGPDYVESLRERLIFIHHLLAEEGSLYIHLDERMVFHLRITLDEIFGEKNFRNCIIRKKCNPKNYTRKNYGKVSDYILFYTKSENYTWNRPVKPWDTDKALKEYPSKDNKGRRYKKVPIHAPGIRNGETGNDWRGKLPPPGKHWQYPPRILDEMDARGEIYWSRTGNPRRKVYLENSPGVPVQNIWMEMQDSSNQNVHTTGYPSEKNPALLAQIIEASSNIGDLVMDCYSGSGTTLEVASILGRKWIGVDSSVEAIDTTLQRLNFGAQRMGDFVNSNNCPSNYRLDPITDFTLYRPISGSRLG